MFTVTSEIYKEINLQPVKSNEEDKVISKFTFKYPSGQNTLDQDGDLIVKRRNALPDNDLEEHNVIELEHCMATEISLVGLQVWRGALLLADYLFYKRDELLNDKHILELGAGVGLTSIAAAIYAQKVICTDIIDGGILDLIKRNIQRNSHLYQRKTNNIAPIIEVMEYDFKLNLENYSKQLLEVIDLSDVIVAADVIYDADITDSFIKVIDIIFEREQVKYGKKKVILISLEKRYVFTTTELDTVAPMFDYFIQQTINKNWIFEYIPITFPQYFNYERSQHLILLQLTRNFMP